MDPPAASLAVVRIVTSALRGAVNVAVNRPGLVAVTLAGCQVRPSSKETDRVRLATAGCEASCRCPAFRADVLRAARRGAVQAELGNLVAQGHHRLDHAAPGEGEPATGVVLAEPWQWRDCARLPPGSPG